VTAEVQERPDTAQQQQGSEHRGQCAEQQQPGPARDGGESGTERADSSQERTHVERSPVQRQSIIFTITGELYRRSNYRTQELVVAHRHVSTAPSADRAAHGGAARGNTPVPTGPVPVRRPHEQVLALQFFRLASYFAAAAFRWLGYFCCVRGSQAH